VQGCNKDPKRIYGAQLRADGADGTRSRGGRRARGANSGGSISSSGGGGHSTRVDMDSKCHIPRATAAL
jgi:hypothetical protein